MLHRTARTLTSIFLASTALLLAGCTGVVNQGQIASTDSANVVLDQDHTVGQTFAADQDGLNTIEFHLTPSPEAQGTIVLHLCNNPTDLADVLTATVHLSAENASKIYRFSFFPIAQSHTHYYYAFLEYTGTGTIYIPISPIGAYQAGAVYVDHQAQEAQTTFRLGYDTSLVVQDWLSAVACCIGYGTATLIILFFSGYWIVRIWSKRARMDFSASLILSAISALGAWMVLLLWASVVGIHFEATAVKIVTGLSAFAGFFTFVADRNEWKRKKYWLGERPFATLLFWSVILLSITLRLFVSRATIMWPGSDAYHHTLIVQLFQEQGGIPDTYEPYAPLVSFSYHFGFHGIVALFRWLFNTELLTTTKVTAAILNGAIAATAGLLTEQALKSRRTAVVTAALVGLATVSPFCLLQWSRFTQTAGLLFLSTGILAIQANKQETGWMPPALLIATIIFSHLRIAFFWGLFLAITCIINILQHHWRELRDNFLISAITLGLAAPWLLRTAWIQYDPYDLKIYFVLKNGYYDIDRLGAAVLSFITNTPLLIGFALFMVVAWIQKKHRLLGRSLVMWCAIAIGIVFAAIYLGVMRFLPWDLTTAILSLPIPLTVLAGISWEILWTRLHSYGKVITRILLTSALLAVSGLGTLYLPNTVYAEDPVLQPGDLASMDWIRDNLPENALILVNYLQLEWAPGWVVGLNAGYWIPLMTQRLITAPPMVYSLEWINKSQLPALLEVSLQLQAQEGQDRPVSEILHEHGVGYIFTTAPHGFLQPQELSKDPNLEEIYHQDQTWIFEVVH